jgi:hypothetical protein
LILKYYRKGVRIMGGNNGNNKKKYTTKEYIQGGVFLVFFVSSLIAMLYFSKRNTMMCLFIFGIYFFVFGLIAITQEQNLKKNLHLFLLLIVGLGIMICAGISMWGKNFNITMSKDFVPILILCLFILVGAYMVFGTLLINKGNKTRCTIDVRAKCIELDKHDMINSNGVYTTVYAPVFNYYYNGTSYKIKLNNYSNVDVPVVGEYKNIYVNPDNSQDVYRPSIKQNLVVLVIGIGTIISSGFGLYLILWK